MRAWIQMIGSALIASLLTVAAMRMTEARAATNVITAKEFQLENASGQPAGFLGVDENGSGLLFMCNPVEATCTRVDSHGVSIEDFNGVTRARLYFDAVAQSARIDLCNATNTAWTSVLEDRIAIFDDVNGVPVATAQLSSQRLQFSYPTPATDSFMERRGLELGVGPVHPGLPLEGAFVNIGTGGEINGGPVVGRPRHGIGLNANRPTALNPEPNVALALIHDGKARAALEVFKGKTLRIWDARGKQTLRK